MTRRFPVPPSQAFEAMARGVQFRDRISVVVEAPPAAIFRALYEVTLRDMKFAWLLGELRYLPSRLTGRAPAADSQRPFMETLADGGTLVLRDNRPLEVITGSAAQLHRVDQAPKRFASREAFEAFDDPGHEKLFMSIRVAPTGRPGEHWLVLEHGTRALSPLAERKFARYWRVIKPMGAVVTGQLLRAVRRRAERAASPPHGSRGRWRSVRAAAVERTRALPGDERISQAIDTLTHGVTIERAPSDVWPWLVQMGAGSRGGWYSYDWLDNGRQPSATRIMPELQHPAVGTIFPALPGMTEGFTLLAIEPERTLTLGSLAPDGTTEVTWTFVLEEVAPCVTRLLVRARGGPGYRFHGLPVLLTKLVVRVVHFIMQRKQLLGIARRAETTTSCPSAFKTPEGEVRYLAAYDAALKQWPVPYDEMYIPSRFGMTHVVATGPRDAPPLVLLHGYWATATMWSPNVADFSNAYRVYAIDVMGQPSKSLPCEPIRNPADYVAWLTATLNALRLSRIPLVGMSYGGWLALNYAVVMPERVQSLVLLSPAASILPIVKQFSLRGMLMMLLPTRLTVNSFMRWLGIKDHRADPETRRVGDAVVDLMYLGLKYFRLPRGIAPTVFSDDELRAMPVPTLLLVGDREVIYDPVAALARARRLIPDFEGDLVPQSNHDMCFTQHRLVDSRIVDFFRRTVVDSKSRAAERIVA